MIAVHHSVYAICCNRIGGNSFCACVLACVDHHTDNNKQQRYQRNEHGVHNGERLALACKQASYPGDVGGSMVAVYIFHDDALTKFFYRLHAYDAADVGMVELQAALTAKACHES